MYLFLFFVVVPFWETHIGGVDLKFPHHDNELAQSEVMVVFIYVKMLFSRSEGRVC